MNKEIRCPRCSKLLGRYDPVYGIKGVIYFCNRPGCKREYQFTIPPEKNCGQLNTNSGQTKKKKV